MTKKFRCLVCGYIHEGNEAPSECPICHVGAEKFEEILPITSNVPSREVVVKDADGNDIVFEDSNFLRLGKCSPFAINGLCSCDGYSSCVQCLQLVTFYFDNVGIAGCDCRRKTIVSFCENCRLGNGFKELGLKMHIFSIIISMM